MDAMAIIAIGAFVGWAIGWAIGGWLSRKRDDAFDRMLKTVTLPEDGWRLTKWGDVYRENGIDMLAIWYDPGNYPHPWRLTMLEEGKTIDMPPIVNQDRRKAWAIAAWRVE